MIIPNKSIKIFLNRVIGPALFVWLTYTIYRQIREQPDLHQSVQHMKAAVYGPEAWKCWLAIMLVVLNWLIEARKWKILLHPLEPVSLRHSLKAVLAGLAFGFGTPNRIGEYGGRALYVSEGKRISSLSLTVVGSFSQLLITLFFGSLGILIMETGNTGWSFAMYTGVFAVTGFCACLYFRLGWIVSIAERLKLPGKWLQHFMILPAVSVTILLRVLCLSAVRYLVFLCQYILLLEVMQVHAGWWNAFWLISVLYLILAVVPTMALLELGIRGKAGILLFQTFSANTVGIYAASTGIWLVNLVLPALAGGLLAIRHKIFNIKQ
ncbi:lysylphosphatidylglycerol synthase domain-containing protein [Agriterribacter sp.]|uniref:lysylphosphatidylglycerol synthase domain-containing protein n=1 Tax=Agriterribacter sp. TaxID=2821509 RepID=UPI002B5513F8|nr:lysylphosphatidylglycerol synthase domain-containing protein [Agriterribacter sp.]HRO48062.1 lysylphosphatidylglycerol synthase domain-containing protein [Agriterribacter sp.]HRQ17255.1 lysylphosphatidylglycerol synthase domain-containing protein [Agriterribacter sp.]